jgi:regulator of protease activity HflC (stomatin/prohibitin superfamily)
MEKIIKPVSGYMILVLTLLGFGLGIYFIIEGAGGEIVDKSFIWIGAALMILSLFFSSGLTVINPNQSAVCTLFGKYKGTIKENGLLFVNPFYKKQKVSLRVNNFESAKLKVNDKLGNPIDIAAVVVWQVSDTYKAVLEISDYQQYVKTQSESAIRHLATSCPYDRMEDSNADITLRDGGEKVIELLESELTERLSGAGIVVKEARITHLAYSPEIAADMLRRQQATAIVAARYKIVEGAVGMVELALEMLSKKQIVELDEEKKAAMVSNLMVVLCGERGAQPVLNTGSLYQ